MPSYNWYRTGTVTLTNGSDVITGSGTTFETSGVTFGEILVVRSAGLQHLLEIVTVDNDLQLRIDQNWDLPTDSGVECFVISSITGSSNVDLAAKIQELLDLRWRATNFVAVS